MNAEPNNPNDPPESGRPARTGVSWRVWKAPDLVWVPIAGGGMILAIGAFGLAMGEPLLFPSLGPTAFLQCEPERHTIHFYNTFVGHLVGLGAGFLAVVIFGTHHEAIVLGGGMLTRPHVAAAGLALALTLVVNLLLRAEHAPAGATTLTVALGGFSPTLHDTLVVAGGVLLVALLGDGLRRVRLRYGHEQRIF